MWENPKGIRRSIISLLLVGVASACAAQPQSDVQVADRIDEAQEDVLVTDVAEAAVPVLPESPERLPVEPVRAIPASLPSFATSGHPRLDTWRDDFTARAIASGRDPAIIVLLLEGVRPLRAYLPPEGPSENTESAAANQAEFAKPIWDYVASAVSSSRRTNGAGHIQRLDRLLDELELNFAVDREAIVAIWAMETNFGGYIGDFDAAETLANMAAEGRRRRLAEGELYALMTIVERGEAARDELISGWAGAMGQTQFMPSVFLTRAVDWDGDGRKDLWNSTADALASAANYLSLAGYSKGDPWGVEIRVPVAFDFSLADGQHRSADAWMEFGLSSLSGGAIDIRPGLNGRLWLPAGAQGPKYLIFSNFDVFLNYNRANAYALSVGLLADAYAGRPGVQTRWPTDLARLNKEEIRQMQAALNERGYSAGPVDGIAGTGTRSALQAFQRDTGLIADGYPTREVLAYVLSGL